jgi:hypothetical protein
MGQNVDQSLHGILPVAPKIELRQKFLQNAQISKNFRLRLGPDFGQNIAKIWGRLQGRSSPPDFCGFSKVKVSGRESQPFCP